MFFSDFAVIYLCDIDEVPEFNVMYELYVRRFSQQQTEPKRPANQTQDPMTLLFFYRNKHMMCDFGTGNNNKLNWVLEDKQELIDIIETIYKGAKKGRGLVVSPKGECNFLEPGGKADGFQIILPDIATELLRWLLLGGFVAY